MTRFSAVFIVLFFIIMMSGCSSKPSKFYVLTHSGEKPAAGYCIQVGLGPVKIAQYLKRPQIVTRLSNNQLHFSEFNRWGEQLHGNIIRVLAHNLSVQIPSFHIHTFPWKTSLPIIYQVKITIIQFDTDINGSSLLVADWRITNRDGSKTFVRRASTFLQQLPSQAGKVNYNAVVAAMDRNLRSLSFTIAMSLRNLAKRSGYRLRRYCEKI